MALWLVRGGGDGEHEDKFITEQRVYLTWEGLNADLSKQDWEGVQQTVRKFYPDAGKGRVTNWSSQIYPFAHDMQKGDWVVMPRKGKGSIAIAEIEGPYVHDAKGADPYFHYHQVRWLETDIPKTSFDQDLLYSFGAFMTICSLHRNDAEARVRAMAVHGWKTGSVRTISPSTKLKAAEGIAPSPADIEKAATLDLELAAGDAIARRIIARFKGHGMARLVEEILRAQGYTTYRSPEGADKGVDILAAPGPMGFGSPRICVQVKSGGNVDHPTLSQLIGTMASFHAEQGLLVSWDGFKSSVEKEVAAKFFSVRLWNQEQLIRELLSVYDKLDAKLRAEIPVKRVWMLVDDPDSESL